ncbi:MAG: cobalt ECF transporter T component CbiQ [Syntrophobacterales bacterium CG_4_8_14_3_um_filter_49_14]|nr:MAG: cobalt ECF transporter T component CbiQ [Syntrophobacterales bacterium CG_4_8_14_3_um_filter_49_14]
MPLRKGDNFIERSLVGALSFLKESVFAEEYASRKGLLQSLDPRIKTATFLLFIVQILLTKSIVILSGLYVFCLLLSGLSNIRLGFFLKRTWVFIPLFSLFIAVPALFNFITPGEALVTFNVAGITFTITRQGLAGASLFVMRVLTSVSFAILLSITTRHFELLKVLRIFKIPQVFVMTLGMCYRYIFLFVEIIEDTYLAIKSRVGARIHYKKGQHIVAWNIASLWARSYQLNEDVYKAMLSRGYQGEPLILEEFKIKARDWRWLFLVLIISTLLFYLNYHVKI